MKRRHFISLLAAVPLLQARQVSASEHLTQAYNQACKGSNGFVPNRIYCSHEFYQQYTREISSSKLIRTAKYGKPSEDKILIFKMGIISPTYALKERELSFYRETYAHETW